MNVIATDDMIASVGWAVSARLLAAGYVVYWKQIDALQVATNTWHFQYSVQQNALAGALAATFAAAKGLVTLRQDEGLEREYLVKASVDGKVPIDNKIPIPSMVIDVAPIDTGKAAELGSNLHTRTRGLEIFGLARSVAEQRWFTDQFIAWFDVNTLIQIRNYATGDGSVLLDTMQIEYPVVARDSALDDVDVVTFEWLYAATLRFEA